MEEAEKENWDFKKIIFLAAVLGIGAFAFKGFILDKRVSSNTSVAGVSIDATPLPSLIPKEEIQQSVAQKINDLKKEVNTINVVEIATSTPAVQKVLNDFKDLQNLPQTQAKEACFKICNGL